MTLPLRTPRARDRGYNVPAESVYEALKRVLNEHFHPKANKEYNRYLFRQAKQGIEESLDHFYARLKKLTMGCEFAEVEAEIKSHLICSCRLARLRRAALKDPSMTLDTMLEKCRIFELAQLQMSKIDERHDNRQVYRMKQQNGGFNRGKQQQHDQNQNNSHINKEGTSCPLKKDCTSCITCVKRQPFCRMRFVELTDKIAPNVLDWIHICAFSGPIQRKNIYWFQNL